MVSKHSGKNFVGRRPVVNVGEVDGDSQDGFFRSARRLDNPQSVS